MKKAQVTMFIMIGMALIVLSGIVFYASEFAQQRVFVRPVEASSAKELVELCLGVIADDALLTIGKQGGVANLGIDNFETIKTSYLFDAGENKVPDTTAVQQELSSYIEEHLGKCLGGFELLKEKGITIIEKSQPRIITTIAERDVRFEISYDLEERKGDMVTSPEFMPTLKAVRLKEILQLANDLVESERNTGLFDLDVDCSLDVIHFPVDNTLVTIISDNSFLIQNTPYRFVFAHKR